MRLAHSLSLAEGSIGNMRKAYILNIRFTLPLLLALALVVAAVLTANVARAQTPGSTIISYAEHDTSPVATFAATDPEGTTPINLTLQTSAVSASGITDDDIADADNFNLSEDGVLTFNIPSGEGGPAPDFENSASNNGTDNVYKVVVAAAAGAGPTGYHKVTVNVTNVDEAGKVTLATDTTNGTPQYLVGAQLTATASDGDITDTDQNFQNTDRAGEVTGVTWRWYRNGNEIANAQSNTYTLVNVDAGSHIRAVVYYLVAGNTEQEMAEKTTDYPVMQTRVGDNKLKFDPATVSRTVSEGAKDRNVGAAVTATGNHGTIRYALSGTDSEQFAIDKVTGQITTKVKLDYEAPTSNTTNQCNTANSCQVTVTANDSTGDAASPSATVNITITDVNDKPTFTTGSQTVDVPENSTILYGASADGYSVAAIAGVTYTADDPEDRTINYSLTGADASKFNISGKPPVLSFASKADFEAKASADGDNMYEVTVRATVDGDTVERMVKVTVGDVDEGPEVSGPSTKDFAEEGTGSVATFTAKDPEGATPIAWFIAPADADPDGDNGPLLQADAVDAEDFDIDEKTGVLTFDVGGDGGEGDPTEPPDFENPSGGGGTTSNTYMVVVGACDVALENNVCPNDGEAGHHKITVKVTKVNEAGKVTLSTSTTNGTPQYLVGAQLTATASDGDITNSDQNFTADRAGEVTGVAWRWYRGGTEIPNAQSNTYTLVNLDEGSLIRAMVKYRVGSSTDQESASVTTDYTVLATRSGTNQLKFDPALVSRTISEGVKGRNVGAAVTATGNHGTIRYDLSGTDAARFKIDEKTGQITTDVVLDYEGESAATASASGSCSAAATDSPDRECTVTVTATDSTGDAASPSATVTITITDVNDKPKFKAASQTAVNVPENSTVLYGASESGYSVAAVAGVTYTADDPEDRTINYSLTGADASKFNISGKPPVLSFASKADFEAKASADGDNMYEVTVQATAGGDTVERMVKVTVVDVDEAPEIKSSAAATDPILDKHDEDNSGVIELDEAVDAVQAYARGEITLAEVIKVVQLYARG